MDVKIYIIIHYIAYIYTYIHTVNIQLNIIMSTKIPFINELEFQQINNK